MTMRTGSFRRVGWTVGGAGWAAAFSRCAGVPAFSCCVGLALLALACGRGTVVQVGVPRGSERTPPTFPRTESHASGPVPDSSGWGTHVLVVEQAPDGAVWVGTYGQGIYVSRDGEGHAWENIRSGDSTSISWDFVNAIAFAPGEVWYGTVGNGWGMSRDGGRTWRNWTFDQLGPRWLYVVPDGIAAAGDTVYIATADGLRTTSDDGSSYRDITEKSGLPNKYLLALDVQSRPALAPYIELGHLRGISRSADGGRTWVHERTLATRRDEGPSASSSGAPARDATPPGLCGQAGAGTGAWVRADIPPPRELVKQICEWMHVFRSYPDPGGPVAEPGELGHFWFRRPITSADNVHLDQTYTYGSTMSGNFQQHQGVEFNNPAGTPVLAIGDGVVVFAGEAEAGARTIAIRHDLRLGDHHVYSTYYHNIDLTVKSGARVRADDLIAHVGSTGRATNDHLHLEIHTTSSTDSSQIVHPQVRYPPYTRNPQLWIEQLPGTGVIAGRVFDSGGRPVRGARVYGVMKPLPRETPFSFAETYEDKAHSDPAIAEHFAIGDVPAGEYVLGVEIEGVRVFRKVRVAPGKLSVVEFRPG
jgi:murein DD-endopeptidase MepM/ murein hydrolase activator NlpD